MRRRHRGQIGLGVVLAFAAIAGCAAKQDAARAVLNEIRAEERTATTGPTATPAARAWECPAGARPLGAPPPLGTEAWCASTAPNGMLVRHGPSWTWSHDGKLIASGEWLDDKRTGVWHFWRAHNSSLERMGSFVAGVEQGWWMQYDESNQIESEGEMLDGERHGWWWVRNTDTRLTSQGPYDHGKRIGIWVELGTNGKPLRERTWRDGRLVSQREL